MLSSLTLAIPNTLNVKEHTACLHYLHQSGQVFANLHVMQSKRGGPSITENASKIFFSKLLRVQRMHRLDVQCDLGFCARHCASRSKICFYLKIARADCQNQCFKACKAVFSDICFPGLQQRLTHHAEHPRSDVQCYEFCFFVLLAEPVSSS